MTMKHLNFNKDDKFRICQVTDIHLDGNGQEETDQMTLNLIDRVIQSEKPDLVVIIGDMASHQGNDARLFMLSELIAKSGIPWACTFGNHDGTEADDTFDRKQLAEFLPTLKNCLFESGPSEIEGYGNYSITIGNQISPEWSLVFMDSGNYRNYPKKDGTTVVDYDYIYRNQIDWYIKQSVALEEQCQSKPSELIFFHIPLPEYVDVWNYKPCVGQKHENVTCPKINTGLFSALMEQGSVCGVFVGHDHTNDFEGELFGIRLCFGRGSGYSCYGLDGYQKGARIIDIDSNNSDFSSYIWLADGSTYQQIRVHRPKLNEG